MEDKVELEKDPNYNDILIEFAKILENDKKNRVGLQLEHLNDITPLELAEYLIKESEQRLEELSNPSIQDKNKYKEEYIKDSIKQVENNLIKYKKSLDSQEKLNELYIYFKDRAKRLEKEMQDLLYERGLSLEELKKEKTTNSTITFTDKLTYSLAAGLIPYKETIPFKMEKGRSKNPLTTLVTLDIEEISDILPSNIEGKDINLLEAIISLLIDNIESGIDTFTLNDIYRVEKKNLKVNPNKRTQEELKKRIMKLMKTLITIDSSEEKQAYYKETNLFYKETSNLLNAHFVEVETKGNLTMAIKVLDIPLLYRYSEAKKQLTSIPFILTDNHLTKTNSVLVLEKYLLRRIAQMRNNKKLTRSILYSTIYDNMNFKQKSKSSIENAKAKTRINAEEILKQLIQTKYIKDYKLEKEGRNQYHKLVIEL